MIPLFRANKPLRRGQNILKSYNEIECDINLLVLNDIVDRMKTGFELDSRLNGLITLPMMHSVYLIIE